MGFRDHRIMSFDVMGTLIDYETGMLDYLRPIAAQAGVSVDDETMLAAFGKSEDSDTRVTQGIPFTRMLPDLYRSVAPKLGLPNTDAHAAGLGGSVERWPAFPDSVAGLKALRKHYRLVAMTNADNEAMAHFSRTLDHPFDDAVTAEDVGTCKPDPRVFAYTLGRSSVHGYRLQNFLHVAQSQYHDIGIAKRLGFTVCWIERRHGKKGTGAQPAAEFTQPHYHFKSLAELVAAVEREA